jgi:heterodisulfide reductase subunit C
MQHEKDTKTFVDEISAIPGGEGIRLCIQCGTCSASCPNADKMEHTPAELIALARAGLRDEVLGSNAMWYCLSCYLCTVRCPRGVKQTDLMHALEGLAARENKAPARSLTPAMYRAFNSFVRSNGRLPEAYFMARYYLTTNPLKALGMIRLATSLMRHGRLSLKTSSISRRGAKQLRAILDKAESLGGVS